MTDATTPRRRRTIPPKAKLPSLTSLDGRTSLARQASRYSANSRPTSATT